MSELNNTLVCSFHPKRETQLRCNRCSKPICIKCATHTPTGYRCPECIRSQQKVFVTTKWFDQLIAGVITGIIAYLGSMLSFLGFYSIFIAIGTGYLIVWVVKKAINNRRSPLLKYVMSGTALLISLIPVAFALFEQFQLFGYLVDIYSLLWRIGFAAVLSGYIFYQLKN